MLGGWLLPHQLLPCKTIQRGSQLLVSLSSLAITAVLLLPLSCSGLGCRHSKKRSADDLIMIQVHSVTGVRFTVKGELIRAKFGLRLQNHMSDPKQITFNLPGRPARVCGVSSGKRPIVGSHSALCSYACRSALRGLVYS